MICEIQNKVVNYFDNLRVGALFMEMGTGKTKTILDIYHSKKLNIKIIYICPASLIKSTKKECKIWYDNLDILFFSSESISQSDIKYIELFNVVKNNDVFLIIDESIKFKNYISQRTRRLLRIVELAKYRFILNGTPITRSILDIYAQMNLLSYKILNMSEREFAINFLEFKLNGRQREYTKWSKPHNEEALMALVKPYVVEVALDIDVNTNIKDVKAYLLPDEKQYYNDIKTSYFKKNYEIQFLAMANYFQQAYTICSDKLKLLKEYVKEDTLIFIKYLSWIKILREHLTMPFGLYTGEIKDDLDNFKLAVLTYGCGSFGLNLQKFNRIIFLDSTFDYGHKLQAIARCRRTGQVNNVEVINIWCNTGLDDMIKLSLTKKNNSYNNIKNIIQNMSKEELRCL